MAQILVRKLDDKVHSALKARAVERGTSAENLAREILTFNIMPESRLKLGDQLMSIWKDADLAGLEIERDTTPYTPPSFD